MTTNVDTVVIGAGHAGLSASRALQKEGVDHVVLERGRVGDTWRTQRWDSFRLNTPAAVTVLIDGPELSEQFASSRDLVDYMEHYVRKFELPVREQTPVERVERTADGFVVHTPNDTYQARHVVVCSGVQNVPVTPEISEEVPDGIAQIHCADYRSPEELPDGAVLVVGAAQSGAQIAEELAECGRRVFLCTSKVGRAPRRYRGRDLLQWVASSPMFDQRTADLPDPAMRFARQARISGTKGGHTLSLHQLARDGVTLLGRLHGVQGTTAQIGPELLAHMEFADNSANQIRGMLDNLIGMMGIDAEPAVDDPAEAQFEGLAEMAQIRELDLEAEGISTVIWATGFRGEMSFMDEDLQFDEHGEPAHDEGVSVVDGVFFVGFPWLRTRASGLIAGAAADATFVAGRIAARGDAAKAEAF